MVTPRQVKTTCVTHGGAATGEYTVRSLSIWQQFGVRLLQQTLTLTSWSSEIVKEKFTILYETDTCHVTTDLELRQRI